MHARFCLSEGRGHGEPDPHPHTIQIYHQWLKTVTNAQSLVLNKLASGSRRIPVRRKETMLQPFSRPGNGPIVQSEAVARTQEMCYYPGL